MVIQSDADHPVPLPVLGRRKDNISYTPKIVSRIAPIRKRIVAVLIDILIFMCLGVLLAICIKQCQFDDINLFAKDLPGGLWLFTYLPRGFWIDLASVASLLLISIVPLSLVGQSFGKMCTGIHVECKNHTPPSFARAFVREWLKSVIGGLSVIVMFFHPKRKGLHDILIGTRVVEIVYNDGSYGWRAFTNKRFARQLYISVIGVVIVGFLVGISGICAKKVKLLRFADIDSVIASHPEFGDAYYKRAVKYMNQGNDIDRALRDMRMANRLCPNRIEFQVALAELLTRKSRILDAYVAKRRHAEAKTVAGNDGSISDAEDVPPFSFDGQTPEMLQKDILTESALIQRRVASQQSYINKLQTASVSAIGMAIDPGRNARRQIGSPCFVVTAASGDEYSFEACVLRNFRDSILAKCAPGKMLISWYAITGPRIASCLLAHDVYVLPASMVIRSLAWIVQLWMSSGSLLVAVLCMITFGEFLKRNFRFVNGSRNITS
jgi:uncharacterized RDD family membrane protein YckC